MSTDQIGGRILELAATTEIIVERCVAEPVVLPIHMTVGQDVAASCVCGGLLAEMTFPGCEVSSYLHLIDICYLCFQAGRAPETCINLDGHGVDLCETPTPRACACGEQLEACASCWSCGGHCCGCCETGDAPGFDADAYLAMINDGRAGV